MALDDSEKRVERPREGGSAAPESAFEEANAGRQDLIREQRAQTEQLKAGGRSGITSEFGRIVLTGLNAMRDGFRQLAGGEPGLSRDQEAERSETGQAGRSVSDVGQADVGATERGAAGRVIQELPGDAQAGSRGFGRMVMDGLQAISRGFRAGERRPRSARAELGEEAPAETRGAEERTIEQVPRDTRTGSVSARLARMLVDRIQGAFGERGGQEPESESGRPVSVVRTDIAEPRTPHTQLDSRPTDFVPITSPEADPLVRQWQRPPVELPPEHPPEARGADAPRAPEAPDRPPEGRGERTDGGRERAGEGDARLRAHPNFRGEVIHLDVEPATHEYHRGERLRDIAAQHLGPGPHDPEDVRRHVREIERLNHLRHGQAIPEGRRLILPGHTADGGYVMRGDGGERRTTWADGVQRVERPDHTGYVRTPTDDRGGYTEHRWGPRPEDNLDFIRTGEGRFQIGGQDVDPGDRRIGRALWENQDEINAEGRAYTGLDDRIQSLEDRLSRQHGADAFDTPEMQRLEHLRTQMQEFRDRAQREGVPPQEVARTFQEVQRLLESDATSPTDAGQRLVLADQIMEHAAHPDSIDQGEHNTCNVSSIETRMYARTPSAAAHLVVEVATTGHFTERAPDGRPIEIDPGSLSPDGEARAERDGRATYETPDGSRDYASQIFQVTAVNIHYAHHDLVWDHPDGRHEVLARAGEVVYRQGASEAPHDTGERLVRRDTGEPIREPGTPPGAEIREPFLRASDLSDINRRISGSTERDVVLTNDRDGMADTTHFRNEAELEQHVARLRDEGHLPAVIRVHTGDEPFFSDSGGGAAGGSGGWHDVTITGYDPATHRITIDNQWGSERDRMGERSLSPHDLYLATLRPGSPEILAELRAREARTHSFDDRMELLRQEREATPPLPRGELNRRMAEALNESNREHPDRPIPGVFGMQRDEAQVQRELRFVQALYRLDERDRRDVLRRLDDGLRQRIERGVATYDRAMTPVARSGERDGAAVQAADSAPPARSEQPADDRQATGVREPSAEDDARRAASEQMAADRGRTERQERSRDSREESAGEGRRERTADRAAEVSSRIDNPAVNAARDRLMQDAEERITNPAERRQFRADMEALERRAQESRLAPQEVAHTYEQISRLLEATGDEHTSARDRVVLAEQVMHQAAHPTAIDQGQHGTCTVASAESRIYTTHPSEAARLVTDVATTGSYRTTDGRTTVSIDRQSIQADPESARSRPGGEAAGSGDRSYASQIFEVTAVNVGHARRDYNVIDREGHILRTIPAGQVRYEQHAPQAGATPPDTGERLMDYSRTPPEEVPNLYGNPVRGTGLSNDQVVDINNAITGTSDAVVIERASLGAGHHTTTVSSPEQLQQTIEQLQRDGRLPAQIHVHSGNEPFLNDSGAGRAGGSGGWHMVTITGYDAGDANAHPPRPARVLLDNQWGEDVDHTYPGSGISVHDLYLATRPPGDQDTIDRLQRDVTWNREHDTVDGFKEFELIRQRHIAGQLTDEQYDEALVTAGIAQAQRWRQERAGGTFDEAERDRAIQHLNEMLAAIRSSDREHGQERADRIVARLREGSAAQAASEAHARSGADAPRRRGTHAAAQDAAAAQQQQQASLARDAGHDTAGGADRARELTEIMDPAAGEGRAAGERFVSDTRESQAGPESRRSREGEEPAGDRESERQSERQRETGRDGQTRFMARPEFPGEIIHRRVEPEIRHIDWLSDESTQSIARQHLGDGALDEDVQLHVREIERINGLEPGESLRGRTELILPGHGSDGSIVIPEARRTDTGGLVATGRETVMWPNGTFREQQRERGSSTDDSEFPPQEGTPGFRRRFDEGGDGYEDHHWGPRAEDNYDLTRTADGRYLIREHGQTEDADRTDAGDRRVHTAQWREPEMQERVERAHDELDGMLDRPFMNVAMEGHESDFRADMQAFERRAREQGLSPEEVERTYRQVSRLMEGQPPNVEHVRMAREIMHHCAYPSGVVQGRAGTCSVASLESQTYMGNPSAAAELVADVALTGRYMTADGHAIVVTPDMVQRSESPPEERGQASEIFQVTAVNIQYQRQDPNLRYAQTDRGEQVYSMRGGYPTTVWTRAEAEIDGHSVGMIDVPRTGPDFVGDDIVDVAGQIRGNRHETTVLESAEAARITGDNQTNVIDNERDLRQTLSTLRREGRLPASVAVHTGNEPFFTDSGGGDAGGSGAWHVVTITDYDDATGRVSIDNQWNPQADRQGSRAVDVQDLYHAMQRPGSEQTIADLQQRQQTEDTALELLRQRHAADPPQISDSDFNRQLGRQLNDHLDWDPEGRAEMWARYRNVLLPMSETDRNEVLSQIEDPRLRQRVRDHLQAEDERRREIDRAMMATTSTGAEREPAEPATFDGTLRSLDASTFAAGAGSGTTTVDSAAEDRVGQTVESLLTRLGEASRPDRRQENAGDAGQQRIVEEQHLAHPGSRGRGEVPAERAAATVGEARPLAGRSLAGVERDRQGHVTRWRMENGQEVTFGYDTAGRLNAVNTPDGSWTPAAAGGWELRQPGRSEPTDRADSIQFDTAGNLTLRVEGEFRETVRHDGSLTREYDDGRRQERNAQGDITSVTYRNGSRITARYSGPEELSEVIAPHGTFRRSEDGHWELQQPGQPPRQAEDVRLDEQGRLSYRLDGESFTVGTDGSTTRRAANGDVVSVTRSDGTTASFEYGQGGRLTAVHEADGTWTRSGYHWEFRATGQPRPTSRADSIELDENNNIVYRQGQDARVVRTDGTERTDYGDRSAVSYGADASVTSVRRSDGTEAAFRYNPPGHLTRIDESSGGSFRRARDGHWDYYEPGHDRPSQRLQDVRIDNGGNITVQTNAQERYLVRRDGTAGSEADLSGGVERDAEGRVTSLTLTDHSRVTLGYDSSGHLNAVSGPDGSWSLNNGRWEFRQPGHSEPSRTADSLELDSNNSLIIREGNDRTIVRRDRTSTTQYGDGSMVTRNAAGEVTNIRLTNGRASNFRYDDNGDLAEIDSPNGSFRQRDGHWELKVPGQPPRAVDSVEVDEHNNIVYEMGGDTYTLRTDGSTTRQTADGDVAILTRGDGSTADFEYDSSGQLTAVHESDGTWRRVDENRWDFYPAGQTRATDSVNSVELDESNSIVYHRDGDTRTVRSNGTERIESEDHSAVEYNADGYVTNVTRTGGDTTTFGYDSDGQLNRVTNQDGSYWRRTSDGRWEHYQREGEEPSARAASVEVREDGSVVVARERRLIGPEATEDGDDRNRTIHRDGSETVEQRDRLAVTRNAAGDVTGLRMSNGSTIQLRYGDNSQLTEVQAARGTFVRREGEWELRVPGQTPQHVDSLELSEDNELVYWIGGDTYTVGHDGSTRVENASGDVTSVTRGDGSTVHFEYDRPGHLTAVREEDGTWSRAGDRWEFRERGRQAASETVDSVRIDANNSIVYRNGQETRTVRTDGSERIAREDRSVVNYRPDGHVSSITRTDGGRVTLDYDSTGHPTAVREGDGTWRRAGDHWEFYPIGHRRPTERVDSVSVDEDGSIIYRVNGHHRDIVRPDGSETRQYDDGRVRNRSANGEVAETHGGAGTGSERHPDRQPTGAPPAAANNAAARRLAEAQREAGFQPDAGARVSSDAAGQAIAGDAGRGRSSQTDGQTSTRPGADQPGQAPRPADAAYGSVQRIEAGSLSPDRAAELRWREDITEQRQHLDQAIERIADPAARAEMRRNMEEFEMRAQRRLMDASQVRDTYRQISRLLEQPSQAGLSEAQRTQLAREVLGQAAHPTTVDQGQHGTCTVASAESRIYTSDPAAASRLVADVALTGRYRSTDGRTTVTINPETLQPDRESQRMAPGGEEAGQSDRSYASQIFQVTAVNLGHARREYTVIDEQGHTLRTIPAGQVRYEPLREPQAGAVPPDSTGERLLDYSRTPPNPPTEIPDMHGRPARSTGLSNDQVVDLNNAITGRTDAVLIEGPGAVGRQTVHVNSAEELRQRLVEYQGHYPVQIAVHSGNEPFAHDSGGGAAGGSGGWHMITITGYDQQTGRVMIDNQWGEATDHLTPGSGISVHDLYLATIPAGDRQIINTLERDVAWNREHITIDTFKELELLRQRRLAGQLSDRQYDDAVAQAMTDAAQRWNRQRANGTFDQAEHDRAITHFQEMASSVGPYRQLDMLRRVHDAGALTDEQYRTEVVVTMTLVRLREQDDRAHGTFDQAQHDRIMPRFDEIRSSMSSEDQLDMARRLRATGYYTDQQYDDAIVSTMVSAAGRWHQQRASGTLDAAERQHTMDRAEEMMTAIRDTDQEHGQERMQSIRDRIVQQVREQRAAEQATAHPAPDAGHQPAQGGGADAGASDHAAPQVPAGGDAAARRVADAQRQATFAPTDGGLEETIRQAAGPASGSDRTVESLLAETGTTGGDRGHHSDLAGRREESESHRGRREAASEAVAPEAVRERLTEHTGTPVARYHGEMIRRDVEPATHTMRADETVEDIARAHLQGTGATEEEIAAHAREINEVNGGFVMEGQELILPGHTSDGGFVTRGAEGSRQTAWADGVVRINNADGTGWVRRFSTDGGMSEHHWGPNPGDNFDLTRTPDGRYRIAEAGRDAEDVAHPETDARVQRAHLEELLDSRAEGPNDRTARIRDDMREFERRAREQHLSDEEIARTYAEVSRMLEHEGDRPLTAAQRLNVAEQVLHQAAHPQTIDQGNHSTCGAASTESRIYTRHPSDAARLVAEVATTGHFTTRGEPQRTVTIDPRNLTPGPEEQVNPPRDGQRSQAGQIFESTFVTLALDSRTTPPGHIRYEQREPHSPPPDDTGEWIVDSTTTPPTETRFDGMLSSDLTRTEELISGRHEAPYVLDRTGDGPGTVRFNSEEELRARLAEAQARGHMPVVIAVDSMNEPFRTDSGGGSAGGSGAGHFVTVTSYDAEHNMVSIDNQWGDEHDHTVHTVGGRTVDRRLSTHDLFAATAPHDLAEREAAADAAHRQLDQDRERGVYDGRREVAALLMDRIALRVTPEEFDRRLVQLARESRQRWARTGESHPGERRETEDAYRQVVARIREQDPARAEALERSLAAAEA